MSWIRITKKPIDVRARRAIPGETVSTREGQLVASPGDWIIQGVQGETYPIKPDILLQTYDFATKEEMERVRDDVLLMERNAVASKEESG